MGLKQLIKRICLKFIKPYIIFESYPDFSDNTKPVYDELVRRGYGKKYNLVWYIENDKAAYLKNGLPYYWNPFDTSSFRGKIKCWGYFEKIKSIILCNRFIVPYPFNEFEKAFYMTHGSPIKDVRDYYTIPKEIDYCLIASKNLVDSTAFVHKYDSKRIIPLGYPRNDVFSKQTINIKKLLNTNADTVIVWYPTFKQHRKGLHTGSKHALPIIHDIEIAKTLNTFLIKTNTLIVLKPHFAQDLSYISDLHLSNIRFIDDSFLREKNVLSYEFLKSCDALLTDYSSVYYDFTLCNKPIGAIWEDIEEYKQNPGLVPEYEYYFQGAVKIYTINELMSFINDVINGNDRLKEKREEIRDYFNVSVDGKNTERVVDFIVEEANL